MLWPRSIVIRTVIILAIIGLCAGVTYKIVAYINRPAPICHNDPNEGLNAGLTHHQGCY